MTSCIISSPPALKVGDCVITEDTDSQSISARNVANQRVWRATIKRKVSKSSIPFANGAIISLVIYSLHQIVANNLLNVLNPDTCLQKSTSTTRTSLYQQQVHPTTESQIFKSNNELREKILKNFNIHCPQDKLSHDCNKAILSYEADMLLETQHHKKLTSHMKLDSHHNTVTAQKEKQQQQNNDEVDWSSSLSSDPTMIYEASHLLSQLLQSTKQNFFKIVSDVLRQLKLQRHRGLFGGVLFAQASQVLATKPSEHSKDTIIVLNITNFNTELIQNKHPFPHIKLIEYYLPHCGICRKFKSAYVKLSKEVHMWRNVIRPSAIDLSVASNLPIAHSWSIEEIPTLRIHPPPSEALSSKLQYQYNVLNDGQKQQADALQDSMSKEYMRSMPKVKTLKVTRYTNDSDGSESGLLRSDLLEYIHSYVEQNLAQSPKTWPNFKPVTETTLKDLMKNHERPELFLIVEQKSPASLNSDSKISLSFITMMDSSSSSAYKAIRYMYASENPDLLKEIISYADRQQSTPKTAAAIETLNSLLKQEALQDVEQSSSTDGIKNKLVLVHVDLTHQNNNTLTSIHPIPFVHIVTPADLVKFEAKHNEQMSSSASTLSLSHDNPLMPRRLNSINRLTRETRVQSNEAATTNDARIQSKQEQQRDQQFMQLTPEQRIKLITLYINEIYTPQPEDKAFVEALAKLDEDPTSNENKLESLKIKRRTYADASHESNAGGIIGEQLRAVTRLFKSATDSNNLTDIKKSINNSENSISTDFGSCRNKGASDYNDKLKAIRYSLFNEVPRRLMNPSDHREKIRTLLDLITVIKHYFPLPDSASIQFIDGVHRYLSKFQYQSLLSDQYAAHAQTGTELNAQAFKRELKRLESEGKRLPEIQEWSYCGSSGYACGLWRLFHTLAAFEYNKLSQINSQQQQQAQHLSKGSNQQESEYLHLTVVNESRQSQQLQQLQKHQQQLVKLTPASQISTVTTSATNIAAKTVDKSIHNRNNTTPSTTAINEVTMPSSVERLVSPSATSTSLSLTIATPTSSNRRWGASSDVLTSGKTSSVTEDAELPTPVLLVMRDYVINYFSCEECAKNFRKETANLSLDRITQFEPYEFSVLWLWEAHNRISKRLSVSNETNLQRPKDWYPSYGQCSQCYKRPPSYLNDPTADSAVIFRESVEWDKEEILRFLVAEYTKTPMDNGLDLFGYQVPYGFVWITFFTCIVSMIIIRCAASYIERQRRHKAATILNGNGVHYSTELQRAG